MTPVSLDASALALAGRNEAWAVRLLGEIAAHGEPQDVEQAEDYYPKGLTLADELGMCPIQAHCYRGLGIPYAKISWPEGSIREERITVGEEGVDLQANYKYSPGMVD